MSAVSGRILTSVKQFYLETLEHSLNESDDAVVIISVMGSFAQNRVDDLLRSIQPLLIEFGAKRRVMKRILSIMIEGLQNINKHGSPLPGDSPSSFLIISKTDQQFVLTTGNAILASDNTRLAEKLDYLNNLSAEELKKIYIEILCNDDFSYKGGAGLGLITMAKKSTHPIEYRSYEVSSKVSFFVQSVRIDNEE